MLWEDWCIFGNIGHSMERDYRDFMVCFGGYGGGLMYCIFCKTLGTQWRESVMLFRKFV